MVLKDTKEPGKLIASGLAADKKRVAPQPGHVSRVFLALSGASRHFPSVGLTLRVKLCGRGPLAEADAARRSPPLTLMRLRTACRHDS